MDRYGRRNPGIAFFEMYGSRVYKGLATPHWNGNI